jgi:drug/metabolite transporter (DMT)-like permease
VTVPKNETPLPFAGEGGGAPSAAAASAPPGVLPHAGAVLGTALWGTMIPIIDLLLAAADPYTLSAVRYALCGVILLAWLALKSGPRWLAALPWGRIALLGLAMAAFVTLYTLGVAYSDPVTAIVVGATGPVISALFAASLYRVPVGRGMGIAFLLATIGAATASLGGRVSAGPGGFRGGEILLVLAAVVWAWYSMQAQRWLAAFGQFRATALSIIAGAVILQLVLLVAVGCGVELRLAPTPAALAVFAWAAVSTTLGGILLWNRAVAQLGIITASLYLNLVPVFGILVASALGKLPSVWQLVGCGVVILGVLQVQRRRAREAVNSARHLV